jgi:Tfp pilus assembly protein FimT
VSRTGFTVIEILMVIVFIGIIVKFGLPKLNFSGYRINGAVRGVVGLLQRAERMAVTNQSNVNVLFDVDNNAIKIHEDINNDNDIQATERVRTYPLGEGVVYGRGGAPAREYNQTISFNRKQNGTREIIFRRDGSASEDGGFYITTTTALNANSTRTQDARSIEITQATGRPSWYVYSGSQWIKRF